MTCPDCGGRQWPYRDGVLTCKNGHHLGEAQPVAATRRWSVPAWLPGVVLVGAAELVRLVS